MYVNYIFLFKHENYNCWSDPWRSHVCISHFIFNIKIIFLKATLSIFKSHLLACLSDSLPFVSFLQEMEVWCMHHTFYFKIEIIFVKATPSMLKSHLLVRLSPALPFVSFLQEVWYMYIAFHGPAKTPGFAEVPASANQINKSMKRKSWALLLSWSASGCVEICLWILAHTVHIYTFPAGFVQSIMTWWYLSSRVFKLQWSQWVHMIYCQSRSAIHIIGQFL